mmetsp:Transcript_107103/g.341210  ORF Transcript_107103/g.341210 Transcript_107103/m.341210 type:complete len:268 (-) Transcript_107103:1049-1852(-)
MVMHIQGAHERIGTRANPSCHPKRLPSAQSARMGSSGGGSSSSLSGAAVRGRFSSRLPRPGASRRREELGSARSCGAEGARSPEGGAGEGALGPADAAEGAGAAGGAGGGTCGGGGAAAAAAAGPADPASWPAAASRTGRRSAVAGGTLHEAYSPWTPAPTGQDGNCCGASEAVPDAAGGPAAGAALGMPPGGGAAKRAGESRHALRAFAATGASEKKLRSRPRSPLHGPPPGSCAREPRSALKGHSSTRDRIQRARCRRSPRACCP